MPRTAALQRLSRVVLAVVLGACWTAARAAAPPAVRPETHAAAASARAEEPPLRGLAQELAAQVRRAAGARPVAAVSVEERLEVPAGRWGADLEALLAERLGPLSAAPGALRVEAILSQTGPRLIASARVVETTTGRLVDLVSASAALDAAWLAPAAPPRTPRSDAAEVAALAESLPLDERVLDLAWADDERLWVLEPGALALYRVTPAALERVAHAVLPGPLAIVRAPGGVLLPVRAEAAVWALTSVAPQAVLFGLEGGRLSERARADALPWPGAPSGVRYRGGTHLLEGGPAGLGPGPFLALDPSWPEAAVLPQAELVTAGPAGPRHSGLRCGSALALLWPELAAVSSADPPGERDALLLLRRSGSTWSEAGRLPMEGALRALAVRPAGVGARLAAALESRGGSYRIAVFELRPPEAGSEGR